MYHSSFALETCDSVQTTTSRDLSQTNVFRRKQTKIIYVYLLKKENFIYF